VVSVYWRKEQKITLEKVVASLISSGIFGRKINNVFANLTKTLEKEDINLIGVSLISSTFFSVVVYGLGTLILVIRIIKMIWRLFKESCRINFARLFLY